VKLLTSNLLKVADGDPFTRGMRLFCSASSVGLLVLAVMGCYLAVSFSLPEVCWKWAAKIESACFKTIGLSWLQEIPKVASSTAALQNYTYAQQDNESRATPVDLNAVAAVAPEIKPTLDRLYLERPGESLVSLVGSKPVEHFDRPVYLTPASTNGTAPKEAGESGLSNLREIAAYINAKWITLCLFIWFVAAIVSLLLRWFVLEFVGDVAIYLSNYKVSKYDEVKQAILSTCTDVARTVYNLKNTNGEFIYERIILVAHSLGSVIAYDVLNRLITDDALAGGCPNRISERTKLFLTFGSPLDKAAFVFRTQLSDEDQVKAALSASTQPLINNTALRPERWINIWSPWDIISGHLDNYDIEQSGKATNARPVENILDEDADIFLFAHNQYWTNKLFINTLYSSATNSSLNVQT